MPHRFVALCATIVLIFPRLLPAQTAPSDAVTIESVLGEIQHGLADAQTVLNAAKMPPLKSVVLTLHTEYDKKGGAKFSVLIFSFGKTWDKQRSNELVLTLTPPPPAKAVTDAVGTHPGLSTALVQAIVSVAQGVRDAASTKPPLVLDTLKAEFGFVVQTSTSAGAKFEISPVSADLSGDLSKKAVHTMTVTFATPKPNEN